VGDEGILLFPWSPLGRAETPAPGWIIPLLPAPCSPRRNCLPSSSLLLLLLQVKAALCPPPPPPPPSTGEGPLHLPTPGWPQSPWPTTASPWGARSPAALVPLLVFSLNKSEHLTQDLVRRSKHWEERQEEAAAAFAGEDMAEREREPSSRMARRLRGRPSVKSQRPGTRGRGRYSLSSCVWSPGAPDGLRLPPGRIFTAEEESESPSPTPACQCNAPSDCPSSPTRAPEIPAAPGVPQPRSTPCPAAWCPSLMVSPPRPSRFPSPPAGCS